MTKRLIGLTGGIATGKSTVAEYLANNHNLPILDADIYARDAVAVGSPILEAIAQRYGIKILLADGNLHRGKLGEIIFNQPEEKNWLESLIHPYVGDRFHQVITQSSAPVLVLVIPLLFEAKMDHLASEIWVVSCTLQQQITRLIQRNNLSYDQAQARINSQIPLAEKINRADVVLDNSLTLDFLYQQIDVALNQIK